MNEKFLKLLIKFNNGVERGAKYKLAKELGITRSIVGSWVADRQIPGEVNIRKMSELFGTSVKELNKIFNRKPTTIGDRLSLSPAVNTSFSALLHAGEVIFLSEGIIEQAEKGEKMKIHVKIMDDSYAPRFAKNDIVVIDTKADPKVGGICLCRSKSTSGAEKKYELRENLGTTLIIPGVSDKKSVEKAVIIGWAVEVISVKKI